MVSTPNPVQVGYAALHIVGNGFIALTITLLDDFLRLSNGVMDTEHGPLAVSGEIAQKAYCQGNKTIPKYV